MAPIRMLVRLAAAVVRELVNQVGAHEVALNPFLMSKSNDVCTIDYPGSKLRLRTAHRSRKWVVWKVERNFDSH
ncbi:hypothetical protein CBM2631_A320034 [Cupriavidus taiwanensis]|nr:hypothetical protein CBM2631_A320034 [Cupriavidus taiwanensis]